MTEPVDAGYDESSGVAVPVRILVQEMPEGDTIFRAARTLQRALAGQAIVRFESVFPAVNRIAEDHPVVGRSVESVTARGKHLLIAFAGDLTLHTHMRMNGAWHVYRAGERWQRPHKDMRVLVATAERIAVGFNIPVAELLTARDLERHAVLRALGPDLIGPSFDAGEILRRMRAHDHDAIGDVLLNQRVAAGVGNVLKSETLFVAGINPFRHVSTLSDAELARAIDTARELMRANVLTPAESLSPFYGRRTTRSLHADARLWVYGRSGQPCRRCGTPIEFRKTGDAARATYWCPRCQSIQ